MRMLTFLFVVWLIDSVNNFVCLCVCLSVCVQCGSVHVALCRCVSVCNGLFGCSCYHVIARLIVCVGLCAVLLICCMCV